MMRGPRKKAEGKGTQGTEGTNLYVACVPCVVCVSCVLLRSPSHIGGYSLL
jgi:tRNA(Arg) A34 adenosine deaminase TadA